MVDTESLNIGADNSTNILFFKCHVSRVMCHMPHVMCNMAHVTCPLSPITYHLALMATATGPHPDNSSTMHSRLVCKDPKTRKSKIVDKHNKSQKRYKKKCPQISNISDTLFDQKSPALLVPVVNGGDIHTTHIFIRTSRPKKKVLKKFGIGSDPPSFPLDKV